jgi:hypothetical protein
MKVFTNEVMHEQLGLDSLIPLFKEHIQEKTINDGKEEHADVKVIHGNPSKAIIWKINKNTCMLWMHILHKRFKELRRALKITCNMVNPYIFQCTHAIMNQ